LEELHWFSEYPTYRKEKDSDKDILNFTYQNKIRWETCYSCKICVEKCYMGKIVEIKKNETNVTVNLKLWNP
jgi:NAD-dependent dihydropyrimidine dehydrogenase PreA subunit